MGTFNMLHGMAVPSGDVDATVLGQAIAELNFDVLGVQEADRLQPRSGLVDQVAVAAKALGAPWSRFVPAVIGTPGHAWEPTTIDDATVIDDPTYGIGLVSRLEVVSWSVIRFPPARWGMRLLVPDQGLVHVRDEPRSAIAAVLIGPQGPMTVVNTHLSFMPGWNARQLRQLVHWLAPMPTPHVLLGDFNLLGRFPAWISRYEQLARTATYPSWRPTVQWDHVLGLGIAPEQVSFSQAIRLPVSDHLALIVDVEL